MPTKITLTAEGMAGMSYPQIRQVIRDALGEFISARDIEAYVAKRYPSWTPKQKSDKANEVAKRIAMAGRLLLADVEFTYEEV
jgi:hypothetical protein